MFISSFYLSLWFSSLYFLICLNSTVTHNFSSVSIPQSLTISLLSPFHSHSQFLFSPHSTVTHTFSSVSIPQSLTVVQIKKIQLLIESENERAQIEMKSLEEERTKNLVMIGNLVHDSVPISNDEVGLGRPALL